MNITASDRKALIRLASLLPKGRDDRREILSGLQKAGDRADGKLLAMAEELATRVAKARYSDPIKWKVGTRPWGDRYGNSSEFVLKGLSTYGHWSVEVKIGIEGGGRFYVNANVFGPSDRPVSGVVKSLQTVSGNENQVLKLALQKIRNDIWSKTEAKISRMG